MTKHARNRCQYCRLQKCLAMGMRSDSPRVAAAQESRRSSVNTQVGLNANKRLSLDKEFLENNLGSALGAAYDSPTLLPRKPIIPDSLMSSGGHGGDPETAQCHSSSTKEEDQSSTLSLTDTSSTHEDALGSANHEKNLRVKCARFHEYTETQSYSSRGLYP